MLLDSFEKQLDLPPASIKLGDGDRRQGKVVHEIELVLLRPLARFDVAQAFAMGKVRKCHAQVLIEARKRFDFVLSPVTRSATTKRRQRQMLHDLGKHQFASVHRRPVRVNSSQDGKC